MQFVPQQVIQVVQTGAKSLQSLMIQFTVENLAPELLPIQQAQQLTIEPTHYVPCGCSCTTPQYFYKVMINSAMVAFIMHGRQYGEIPCMDCVCKTGNCLECGKCCKVLCSLCEDRFCPALCQCIFGCGTCLSACQNCCEFIPSVQQFEDYENIVEVKHTMTPLGWATSEKDGLYVGLKEFAEASFYQIQPFKPIDWQEIAKSSPQYRATLEYNKKYPQPKSTAANQLDTSINNNSIHNPLAGTNNNISAVSLQSLNQQAMQGVPSFANPTADDVNKVLACFTCTAHERYLLQREAQLQLTESYPINYQGKYIGRYIYGYQSKPLVQMCCPLFNLPGYSRFDDVFLLDQFDALLFRCRQKSLACCVAWSDRRVGANYVVQILDTKGNEVATMTKTRDVRDCGCRKKWQYQYTFTPQLRPIDKILILYLFPFLNEKHLNVWNKGDTHGMVNVEHDVEFGNPKIGKDEILADRIVDTMSYDNMSMTAIPGLLSGIIAINPTRDEARHNRLNSYQQCPILVQEYVRKKKLQLKKHAIDHIATL